MLDFPVSFVKKIIEKSDSNQNIVCDRLEIGRNISAKIRKIHRVGEETLRLEQKMS